MPEMPSQSPPSELRADAARNRVRVLAAAAEVFAERGLDGSTAEIAHRAGVGEATLYRRFATKDDLIVAILIDQMEEVRRVAADCLADPDPWRGVERFFVAMVERTIEDRGRMEAMKSRCLARGELDAPRAEIVDAVGELVRRAQEAGAVRADLTGPDLLLLITAAASIGDLPFAGLRDDLWRRYVGVVLDGIRPGGATPLRPPAPLFG
jgi:AcrR family transcriptional regulator